MVIELNIRYLLKSELEFQTLPTVPASCCLSLIFKSQYNLGVVPNSKTFFMVLYCAHFKYVFDSYREFLQSI